MEPAPKRARKEDQGLRKLQERWKARHELRRRLVRVAWNELDNAEEREAVRNTALRAARAALDQRFGVHDNQEEDIDLEDPVLSMDAMCQMIETFKQGARLPKRLVLQIARKTTALLCTLPNVVKCDVPAGGKLTVVGDLHGQLPDLLHVFSISGLPTRQNHFVFNGDWVDRGERGSIILKLEDHVGFMICSFRPRDCATTLRI